MPLSPPLDATPDEVRALLLPLRQPLSIAVIAAGNAFAVGAIIRVAHSYLVREIVLVGDEPHYEKASMGMEKLERIVRVPDADAFFAHACGRPVFAFEREVARRSVNAVDAFPDDVILAFGSERFGFPDGFLARCDDVLAIPLYGVNNSLPLAVATGVALAAWARTRFRDGAIVTGPARAR